MGLWRAGFEVYGVDMFGQPQYPFKQWVKHVEQLTPEFVAQFDFVWASPPCQRWSQGNVAWKNQESKPDLIPFTRQLLTDAGVAFVIENVPKAPLRPDLLLCGSMFGLRLVRHRHFEVSGFPVNQPEHKDHHWKYVTVAGTPGGKSSRLPGIGYGKMADWEEAMGIDWMSARAMSQAVPPIYAEFIAKEFLDGRD